MPYDVELADRVRALVHGEPGLTEKRMFGGLAFLLDGHMAVAAGSGGGLMVRLDPRDGARLAGEPGARPFEMRGRAMTGWLDVDAEVLGSDSELRRWVGHGVAYVRSLPPKQ